MAYGTGCDGGGGGTGGSGGETGGSTTSSGGSGGTSTGGTGGSGGGTTSTGGSGGSTSTGGTGGAGGGTGGTGGSMMGNLVNGCDPATAEDHTNEAMVTIMSSGFKYVPACIKIAAGSSVTFSSNFMFHPLVGGTYANAMKMPDAASPIQMTTTGMMATFAFPDAGTYGFYCDTHVATQGMMGAVFVQ